MYKSSIYNNLIDVRNDGARLYYNAATGALAWLNREVHSAFESNSIDSLEKDLLEGLQRNGFIVPDYCEEYERYMFKSRQYTMDSRSDIASYIISLSMQCNLRCVYCFEEGRYDSHIVSDEQLEGIFKFITSEIIHNNKKRLHITWFGGEPMMAYEKIIMLSKRLISFCQNNNIIYLASMATNGVLLDENKLTVLKNECLLKHIQVPVDGDQNQYSVLKNASTNDYSTMYNNLLEIVKVGIGLSVRLNVCKENIVSLKNFVSRLTSEKDFHAIIYLGKLIKYNDSELYHEASDEELLMLEEYIYSLTCKYKESQYMITKQLRPKGASCGYMVHDRCLIDSKGYLYRCEHHISNKQFAVGDIENGFYHNHIDNEMIQCNLPRKCQECSIMPICMGGCVSDRLYSGKFASCKYLEERVQLLCKRAIKIGFTDVREVDYGTCD